MGGDAWAVIHRTASACPLPSFRTRSRFIATGGRPIDAKPSIPDLPRPGLLASSRLRVSQDRPTGRLCAYRARGSTNLMDRTTRSPAAHASARQAIESSSPAPAIGSFNRRCRSGSRGTK